MAFRHSSLLEEVGDAQMLRQEQPRTVARHRDVEEVVEVAKICHGKLGVEACCDEL